MSYAPYDLKVDVQHARRLIPYSIPALLGVIIEVYTEYDGTPVLIKLVTIVVCCDGNCEVENTQGIPVKFHTKLFNGGHLQTTPELCLVAVKPWAAVHEDIALKMALTKRT
jgi:hypothetical protein